MAIRYSGLGVRSVGPVGGFLGLNTAVTFIFVIFLGEEKNTFEITNPIDAPSQGIRLCNDKKRGALTFDARHKNNQKQ